MNKQFSRTELLIGNDAIKKLANTKIAIFGIGGVGSYVVEALARVGVGSFVLIDNDIVNPTNINRQIIALHSTVGEFKVDVEKKRILDITPNAKVECINKFFSKENSNEFDFTVYDYVVDAIDSVASKIELILKSQEANTPIISSMGTGNKLNPTLFEISDIYKTSVCPLARVMRTELKKRGVKKLKVLYSKETPIKQDGQRTPASISFVPSVAGLIIAGEVIKDIIKTEIS
ncbi:tRNA threonylcarbamoyladenosine dehydratase [bacterium]|nr:tRNA threonylcarbamoyladenosine dehydratase [bacterium]